MKTELEASSFKEFMEKTWQAVLRDEEEGPILFEDEEEGDFTFKNFRPAVSKTDRD